MASNFNLAPGEHFVPCPYNKSHIVTNKRIITHLNKCRQNYLKEGKSEIVPCRFNYHHQIPFPERKMHEDNCQDASSIIPALTVHVNTQPVTEVNRVRVDDGDDEEDWDADVGIVGGYDPKVKLEKELHHYMPRGMTPSERRAFREENRKKWSAASAGTTVVKSEDTKSYNWDEDED